MNAEEFAEKSEDHDWVHQSKVVGEVVYVTLKRSSESPYTFNASLPAGWVMVYEDQKESGDVRTYAPLEWFTDAD